MCAALGTVVTTMDLADTAGVAHLRQELQQFRAERWSKVYAEGLIAVVYVAIGGRRRKYVLDEQAVGRQLHDV